MNKCLTLMNKSLDGDEATKKRPAAVWRQTGDDSKGVCDANRSKFICYAIPAGLQFLGWRSLQRRNCRDQGRYDYQAGASAWRGVEIRRRVAGWEANDLHCRPTSNR